MSNIKNMVTMGMSYHQISFVVGCDPATFHRRLAEQKKLYEAGDRSEYNLYAIVELGVSSAAFQISKSVFEVAVKDKNPGMLRWLAQVKLGWTPKIEVEANIKRTIVFETQLADGSIKQTAKEMSDDELLTIDTTIDSITEALCPSNELDSD